MSCEKKLSKGGEDAKSSHIGEEVRYIVRREHNIVKNSGRVRNKRTKEVGLFKEVHIHTSFFYAAT